MKSVRPVAAILAIVLAFVCPPSSAGDPPRAIVAPDGTWVPRAGERAAGDHVARRADGRISRPVTFTFYGG